MLFKLSSQSLASITLVIRVRIHVRSIGAKFGYLSRCLWSLDSQGHGGPIAVAFVVTLHADNNHRNICNANCEAGYSYDFNTPKYIQ